MAGPTHPQTDSNPQHIVRTITSQDPKDPEQHAVLVGDRPVPQVSPLLTTLETVFGPAASARDRQLARVIRCLAHYLIVRPIEMSDEELEILLAVSIVLRRPKATPL
jgi:hypothetical protein